MVLCHRATGSPQSESTAGPAPAADPVAAALAGFDETTGLWFPPDAPRDVYLDRSDPKHDLILDVRKSFDANPALRRAVCALAADPKREVRASTLSQSVRQRITMFQMLCAGIEANEEEKAKSEKAWSESEARFEKWMNVAAARELSLDERRDRMLHLDAELEKHTVDDAHLKAAFGMLGLMPQSEYVVYRLLRTSPYHRGGKSETRFQDFLRRLLERESADGRPEAPRYRMALRHLLFYGNRFPEARALSRRLVDEEALARWKTDNRAFLAVLDRLAGDASALKSAASSCEPPDREKEAYEGRPRGAYCSDVALGAATRSIDLLGEKASKGLVDVLAEVIAAEPANWSHRINAIQYIAVLDPSRGRILTDELLQVPATLVPLHIRLDALVELGETSRKLRDFPRALRAYDFYLDLLRYRPVPVPADIWSRLTALPEEEKGPRTGDERVGWLNITYALGRKVQTCIDAGDFAPARRALESLLATTFALADVTEKESQKEQVSALLDTEDMEPADRKALEALLEQETAAVRRTARDQARFARSYLRDLGVALQKAGRADEAKRVVAYLVAQPGGPHQLPTGLYPLYYGSQERGQPVQPAASPWDAVGAPAPRAAGSSRGGHRR